MLQPRSACRRLLALAIVLNLSAVTSHATEYDGGVLHLAKHFDWGNLEAPALGAVEPAGGLATEYLNIDEYLGGSAFLGQGFAHGSSITQGANTITRMVADDLVPGAPCGEPKSSDGGLFLFYLSVANFDAGPVVARVRVRFYLDAAGVPGQLVAAYRFNPVEIGPGVSVFATGTGFFDQMPNDRYWAGIVFDNNDGTTGATAAQLDMLGQGVFGPPSVGSSMDEIFMSESAGDNLENSPPGSIVNSPFAGNPPANFGWEIITICGGLPALKSTWGSVKSIYR